VKTLLELVAASLLWAFSFGLIKRHLATADPFAVAAVRLGISLLVFLPWLLRTRLSRGLRARRAWPGLAAWHWGLDEKKATYHALYPRAWTVYEEPSPGLNLVCRQVSPVVPHNYVDSSYPAGVFVWTIENTGKTGIDVSLMFTFQNGTGGANDLAGGHCNEAWDDAAGAGGPLRRSFPGHIFVDHVGEQGYRPLGIFLLVFMRPHFNQERLGRKVLVVAAGGGKNAFDQARVALIGDRFQLLGQLPVVA